MSLNDKRWIRRPGDLQKCLDHVCRDTPALEFRKGKICDLDRPLLWGELKRTCSDTLTSSYVEIPSPRRIIPTDLIHLRGCDTHLLSDGGQTSERLDRLS